MIKVTFLGRGNIIQSGSELDFARSKHCKLTHPFKDYVRHLCSSKGDKEESSESPPPPTWQGAATIVYSRVQYYWVCLRCGEPKEGGNADLKLHVAWSHCWFRREKGEKRRKTLIKRRDGRRGTWGIVESVGLDSGYQLFHHYKSN